MLFWGLNISMERLLELEVKKQNHQMGGGPLRSQRVRVNAAVSSPIITNTGDPVVRERYPSNFIYS